VLRTSARLDLAALIALALAFAACATIRAARIRHQALEAKTERYRFERAPIEVWSATKEVLSARGFQAKDSGEPGTFALETDWKFDNTSRTRYVAEVTADDDGVRLEIDKDTSFKDGLSTTRARDLDLELEVIRALDPDAAARIQLEANEAADGAG
jgi:hypothetical protein